MHSSRRKRITKVSEWERECLSVPGVAGAWLTEEVLSITEEVGGEQVGSLGQGAPGGPTRERVGSLAPEQRGATRGL